jgi:hypothetical protein
MLRFLCYKQNHQHQQQLNAYQDIVFRFGPHEYGKCNKLFISQHAWFM